MADIVFYQRNFLPGVIRLFNPSIERVDGQLPFFQQLFSLYQPPPEESCLLLKGADKLLACAYLISLNELQPNLLYAHIAFDSALSWEEWDPFWQRCLGLGRSMVSNTPVLRTAATETSALYKMSGFKIVREHIIMRTSLDNLPPGTESDDAFAVVSLAQAPHQQQSWLDTFNQGLSAFYDLQPFDDSCLQRLKAAPGFDGDAFRLGLVEEAAVAALFYWLLDENLGLARISIPASPSGSRGRGFGRRMLKDTLNHLKQRGVREAIIYTDAANQATNLLYKMQGFNPQETIKVMECQVPPLQTEALPEPVKKETPPRQAAPLDQGFFTAAHSAFEPKKKKRKEPD